VVRFEVKELSEIDATLVEFEIVDGVLSVEEGFSIELPEVPFDKGVILSGRGPIWFYGRLLHAYHPSRWVAVFDPRLGAVVVASHWRGVSEGTVIPREKLR